ncbi:hypothetical protein CGRA01v4_09730 [Colletotrichum graminicola]|nr:hypothetical protein CGRA01v4_09730 [Colletotrichum graminicola]
MSFRVRFFAEPNILTVQPLVLIRRRHLAWIGLWGMKMMKGWRRRWPDPSQLGPHAMNMWF